MSDKDFYNLSNSIQQGLDKAFFKMLKLKAALDQNIVITDSDGNPIEVSAKDFLDDFNKS